MSLSGGYTSRAFTCPYYVTDKKNSVICEAGVVRFPDSKAATNYYKKFCAGEYWKDCTLSYLMSDFYERNEEFEKK